MGKIKTSELDVQLNSMDGLWYVVSLGIQNRPSPIGKGFKNKNHAYYKMKRLETRREGT